MISKTEAIATLKKVWNVQEFKFLAQFHRPRNADGSFFNLKNGDNFGFLQDFLANDRKIVYPKDKSEERKYNREVSFKIPLVDGLEDQKYYLVELELETDDNRVINPYLLKVKNVFVLEDDHLSPKEFIKKRFFEKGHTPSDASTIASQLSLNELELYTHTKRFIFELIQNADDMPRHGVPLSIEINLTQNNLLFLHNGKFFDREDVKAICDAAKSTKKSDVSQTGYKGIGFKSVFTDSSKVFIKSGSYFFKFDKTEGIYKDFWKLYDGYIRSLNEDSRIRFIKEYKGKESEFLKIDNIPWQIKPLWVERNEITNELLNSPFNESHQVAIALNVGEQIINDREKDYHKMIIQLINEPRFLLFLRHTERLSYNRLFPLQLTQNSMVVEIERRKDSINVSKNNEVISNYIKHDVEISLNNEEFLKAGLNFQKVTKKDKVVYVDLDGRPLDNIPEKLVYLEKTTISFAAQTSNRQIDPIPKENSILFNYLPTSDSRFGFPFLLNADFVSKTDREFIQVENKWNHYIFYHIGYNLIKWLRILSLKTDNNGYYTNLKSYLKLLPSHLLDENNDEQGSINRAFNNGVRHAINKIPFIISYGRLLIKCSDVIIDQTGITKVLKSGDSFFKRIWKTPKQLPFFLIDNQNLSNEYLCIETFSGEHLVSALTKSDNRKYLSEAIVHLDNDGYLRFLKWFDNFIKFNPIEGNLVAQLPIFKIENLILCLVDLNQDERLLLNSKKFSSIHEVLIKLGFKVTQLEFDEFSNIWDKIDAYLIDDKQLFGRVSKRAELSLLSANEKSDLISFIKDLDGVGKEKYAENLHLFSNRLKIDSLKPLRQLISNKVTELPTWLFHFQIDIDEENALDSQLQKYLLNEQDILINIFGKDSLFLEATSEINLSNIIEFYQYLDYLIGKNEESLIGLAEIPWLYISAKQSFERSDHTYFPESLLNLHELKYRNVQNAIASTTDLLTPPFSSFELIKKLSLGSIRVSFKDAIKDKSLITSESINDFLDWLELNNEQGFLEKHLILKAENQFRIELSAGRIQYYSPSEQLIKYIESQDKYNQFKLLDNEVYASTRLQIGLVEGDNLFDKLIDKNCFDIELVHFFNSKTIDAVIIKFLLSFGSIKIHTDQEYSQDTEIYKTIKFASELLTQDEVLSEKFRNILYVDNFPLKEKAISDDIYFKKTKTELKIKLSDVLSNYKEQTYSLTGVMNVFSDIDRTKLRKLFEPQRIPPQQIFKELYQLPTETFNPAQTFFLLFYQQQETLNSVFTSNKGNFVRHFKTDKEAYSKSAIEFLNICIKHDCYTEFSDRFQLPDLKCPEQIIESKYALESELLPDWIRGWITGEENSDKLKLLKLLGANDLESPVVQLRKAMLEGIADGSLNNVVLFKNTLVWLGQKSLKGEIKLSEDLLKPLYVKAVKLNIPVKEIVIPALKNVQQVNYSLETFDGKVQYHVFHEGWGEWKSDIFIQLSNRNICIISNVLPTEYIKQLNAKILSAVEELDEAAIQERLVEFKHRYYLTWLKKGEFPIKVFKGSNLPYKITYDSIKIKALEKGTYAKSNRYLVVSEDILDSIPKIIRSEMRPELYSDLNSHKTDFEANSGNINYSDEELAALKKIYNEDIPEVFKKNLNLAALVSALVHLPEQGFDIDEANINLESTHEFAQLFPVYKSNDRSFVYTIMCRSARQGLLYMTAKAWDRLDDDAILLFADLGYDFYKLFYNKQDVLNEKSTDYQILRIETDAKVSNVDDILKGTFLEKDKIWIIFSLKENKNFDALFYNKFEADNTANNTATVRVDNSGISY